MPKLPGFDPIDFLIRANFPEHAELSRYYYGDQTGLPLQGRKRLLTAINAYKKQLSALPRGQIDELVQKERDKQANAEEASQPFNRPLSEEDIAHWGSLACWFLEEAVALSLGIGPRHAKSKSIAAAERISPLAQRVVRLRERVVRSEQTGELSNPISPHKYVEWALRNRIDLPKGLIEGVTARSGSIEHHKSICDANEQLARRGGEREAALAAEGGQSPGGERSLVDRPLKARERDSLLSILIACAIKRYDYRPGIRSDVPRQISQQLERWGLPLSEDTVRNHLTKAAELLPGDWQKR